ncbi:hypothetical protein KEM48_007053, partial [Puccinia striiformis f. sp. tritici PST-130]
MRYSFIKYFKKKEIIEKKKEAQVNKNKSKKGVTEDQDFGGRGGSDDGSSAEESSEEENERSILPDTMMMMRRYEENDEVEVWKAMKKSMGKELKKAMPDDDDDGVSEDEWSEIDPAQFDDSDDEDDLKLKELLADHDDDEVSELDNSLMFSDNEEIQVSGLDDDSQSEQDQSSHKLNPSRKRKSSQQEELATKKKEMKDGQVDDDANKSSKKKRKTWKTLPTFASADDYQHLLADQEETGVATQARLSLRDQKELESIIHFITVSLAAISPESMSLPNRVDDQNLDRLKAYRLYNLSAKFAEASEEFFENCQRGSHLIDHVKLSPAAFNLRNDVDFQGDWFTLAAVKAVIGSITGSDLEVARHCWKDDLEEIARCCGNRDRGKPGNTRGMATIRFPAVTTMCSEQIKSLVQLVGQVARDITKLRALLPQAEAKDPAATSHEFIQ